MAQRIEERAAHRSQYWHGHATSLSRIVVDLDSNEMLANNARDILIRIGFLIHDMTPMTPDCLEIEQHNFFLSRRSIEYVGRPWLPVGQIWMSARRLCCR